MAVLIIFMLFIGVAMVSSAHEAYPDLLAWHRPIGLLILILVVARLIVRVRNPPPPLPTDLPAAQKAAAKASHYLLYATMFAMPIIGWAMQSAGGYPIVVWKGFELFPILPHNIAVYGALRVLHGVVAYLFFILVLGHLAAALTHALIRRDGVFQSMSGGGGR
ncbi:cytochrome b [Paraburkholderia pallida]|uniref:Cytochrome b n=2 Tax=Paraburkholderia pallida TaxID=2547399 RepID=A0A4P7D6U5_9BURK|nr:cytochrome b [Paraburkholderia pallida]